MSDKSWVVLFNIGLVANTMAAGYSIHTGEWPLIVLAVFGVIASIAGLLVSYALMRLRGTIRREPTDPTTNGNPKV
jgi:membrane protein DedA with SNARE-associated domain